MGNIYKRAHCIIYDTFYFTEDGNSYEEEKEERRDDTDKDFEKCYFVEVEDDAKKGQSNDDKKDFKMDTGSSTKMEDKKKDPVKLA